MTTWNEHETDKCWEEVKSILMGELVMDVLSENHGCVIAHRGINFPSSVSDAENGTGCVQIAHFFAFRHKDHATNETDVVRLRNDEKTRLAQSNEMEPTGIRMEVKQQTC